jgi:hypothetical protein
MKALMLAALAGGALLAAGPAPASADSIYDLEHARGNARAGGPISEFDADLLERWGALSGTPDWRRRVRGSAYSYSYDDGAPYRPWRRAHHRRVYRD